MNGEEKVITSKTERQKKKKERSRLRQRLNALKQEVKTIENDFESLTENITEIEEEMGETDFYSRTDHLERLKEYRNLTSKLEEVTVLWEEKSLELEELEERIKKSTIKS